MRTERARLVAGIGAALVLVGGCGGSSKPALQSASSTPTTSTSVATAPPSWSRTQVDIIHAYVGFWSALPKASRARSDLATLGLLNPVTTDPELSQLFSTLHKRRQQHQALYGVPIAHVQSVDVTGGTATLQDCQNAAAAGIETTSGRKLTVGVANNPVTATLLKRGSVWKVSTISHPQGGTC
jgi:hypothetical protein